MKSSRNIKVSVLLLSLVLCLASLAGCRGNAEKPTDRLSSALDGALKAMDEKLPAKGLVGFLSSLESGKAELSFTDDPEQRVIGSDFDADVSFGKSGAFGDFKMLREGALFANPLVTLSGSRLSVDYSALGGAYGVDLYKVTLPENEEEINSFDAGLVSLGKLLKKLEDASFDPIGVLKTKASVSGAKNGENYKVTAIYDENAIREFVRSLGMDEITFKEAKFELELLLDGEDSVISANGKLTGEGKGTLEYSGGNLTAELELGGGALSASASAEKATFKVISPEEKTVSASFSPAPDGGCAFEASFDNSELYLAPAGTLSVVGDTLSATVTGMTVGTVGTRAVARINASVKVTKTADFSPDAVTYSDYLALDGEKKDEVAKKLGELIDPEPIEKVESILTFPEGRMNGIVPAPEAGYISSIDDNGKTVKIIYRRLMSVDNATGYAKKLKEAGFTEEQDASVGAPVKNYNFAFSAKNPTCGWIASVYYNDYYGEMTVLVTIPDGAVTGFGWPDNPIAKHVPEPAFGRFTSVSMKDSSLTAYIRGASGQNVLDYTTKLKRAGFKKKVATDYDTFGDYNYGAVNDAGYTAIIAAEDDGTGLYDAYVIVIAPVEIPDEVPEFDYGKLAKKQEQDGVTVLAYTGTKVEQAKEYAELLKSKGFTEAMRMDTAKMDEYEFAYGAYDLNGFGICVYYQGDGITCIMAGYFSF